MNMNMIRVNFYLSKLQVDKLKEISQSSGLSISEHIRRAIDLYIKEIRNVERGPSPR
jgi:metal-responsive CopG/Arc/MetJ family transcriptional regulator